MVGQVFTAGDIDYRMFQTIVCRSDLTVDGEVLAPWPPSSLSGRLAGVDDPAPAGVHVDAIVARADALRRQKKTQADRNLDWAQPRRCPRDRRQPAAPRHPRPR